MKDFCGMEGNVTLKIFDSHTDELLETFEGHNLIVATGVLALWANIKKVTTTKVNFFSVRFNNSSSSPVAWSDEDIVGGWTEKELLNTTTFVGANPAEGGGILCTFELLASEGNGKTINEMSLWLELSSLTDSFPEEYILFSRIKRANIVKTSAIRIEGSWEIRSSVAV